MRVAVLADECTAAGFRLAGCEVRVPQAPEEVPSAFAAACATAALVLLTPRCAAALPRATLEAALAGFEPLVLVVPDVAGREPVPDVAAEVRRALAAEGA